MADADAEAGGGADVDDLALLSDGGAAAVTPVADAHGRSGSRVPATAMAAAADSPVEALPARERVAATTAVVDSMKALLSGPDDDTGATIATAPDMAATGAGPAAAAAAVVAAAAASPPTSPAAPPQRDAGDVKLSLLSGSAGASAAVEVAASPYRGPLRAGAGAVHDPAHSSTVAAAGRRYSKFIAAAGSPKGGPAPKGSVAATGPAAATKRRTSALRRPSALASAGASSANAWPVTFAVPLPVLTAQRTPAAALTRIEAYCTRAELHKLSTLNRAHHAAVKGYTRASVAADADDADGLAAVAADPVALAVHDTVQAHRLHRAKRVLRAFYRVFPGGSLLAVVSVVCVLFTTLLMYGAHWTAAYDAALVEAHRGDGSDEQLMHVTVSMHTCWPLFVAFVLHGLGFAVLCPVFATRHVRESRHVQYHRLNACTCCRCGVDRYVPLHSSTGSALRTIVVSQPQLSVNSGAAVTAAAAARKALPSAGPGPVAEPVSPISRLSSSDTASGTVTAAAKGYDNAKSPHTPVHEPELSCCGRRVSLCPFFAYLFAGLWDSHVSSSHLKYILLAALPNSPLGLPAACSWSVRIALTGFKVLPTAYVLYGFRIWRSGVDGRGVLEYPAVASVVVAMLLCALVFGWRACNHWASKLAAADPTDGATDDAEDDGAAVAADDVTAAVSAPFRDIIALRSVSERVGWYARWSVYFRDWTCVVLMLTLSWLWPKAWNGSPAGAGPSEGGFAVDASFCWYVAAAVFAVARVYAHAPQRRYVLFWVVDALLITALLVRSHWPPVIVLWMCGAFVLVPSFAGVFQLAEPKAAL